MPTIVLSRFYVFSLIFSSIAVYWSFDYVSRQSGQFFNYTMWTLFLFYLIAFFGVGSLWIYEMTEIFTHKHKLRKLERQSLAANIDKMSADAYLVRSKGDTTGFKEPAQQLSEGVNSRVLVDLSDAIRIPEVLPLIKTIESYQRILVLGAQEAGKTATMLWLAQAKCEISRAVLVIDTHASPKKWPKEAHVLGYGLNYEAAHKGFNGLITQMNKRYMDIGAGRAEERSHPIITVLTDEWTMLPDMIPKFTEKYVKPLFTLSRKTGIDLSLAAHDSTVGALGMTGYAKFRKSFDVVVFCEKIDDNFKTMVQFGIDTKTTPKRVHCLPPGPYIENGTPAQPDQEHVRFESIGGVLKEDIKTLEYMRLHYDHKIEGVWKQRVRKELNIPATVAGYEIIDKVGMRYNIKLA